MPQALIAEGLGISVDTLARLRNTSPPFADALKRGIHARRMRVLRTLDSGMDKSFIPAIFEAKQPHILGFQDVQTRQHIGEIRIVIEERVLHEGKSLTEQEKSEATDVDE